RRSRRQSRKSVGVGTGGVAGGSQGNYALIGFNTHSQGYGVTPDEEDKKEVDGYTDLPLKLYTTAPSLESSKVYAMFPTMGEQSGGGSGGGTFTHSMYTSMSRKSSIVELNRKNEEE